MAAVKAISAAVPDPGEVKANVAHAAENTDDVGFALDFDQKVPRLRPLHGLCNYAPVQNAGTSSRLPISEILAEMKIPYCYFHDAVYENSGWDLIDITRIFPIFSADENDPANYRFRETDIYLERVIKAGTGVIFRLGESIELSNGERQRVNPPADFEKWANICINVARHYTRGWANGFNWDIRDWAIWEEPNNPNLWTGAFEDYLKLYEVTARKFKAALPELNIGGPQTTTLGIRFLDQFLAYCRQKDLPLDFVCYTAYYHTPAEIIAETFKRRQMLDQYGFNHVPMWINEWHGSPVWADFADTIGYLRESDRIRGFDGAVFAGTVLCGLQDTPVERACYYAVAMPGGYGIFDERRMPTPQFYMFEKYCRFFNNAVDRIAVSFNCNEPNVKALAAKNKSGNIELLLGCYLHNPRTFNFEIPAGFAVAEVEIMDKLHGSFSSLQKWEYANSSSTISLHKNEGPTAFFVTLVPVSE